MSVRLPSLEQKRELGGRFELVPPPAQTTALQRAFKGSLASFARLEELVPPGRAAAAGLRRCFEGRRRAGNTDAFVHGANSPGEAALVEFIEVVLNMQANTCSFDVSEPSAFAVPCGLVRGLPVEEVTLIQLVQTIEKTAIGRNTRAKARGSDNDTNGLALSRIARGR
jgi:hypothetical protein